MCLVFSCFFLPKKELVSRRAARRGDCSVYSIVMRALALALVTLGEGYCAGVARQVIGGSFMHTLVSPDTGVTHRNALKEKVPLWISSARFAEKSGESAP